MFNQHDIIIQPSQSDGQVYLSKDFCGTLYIQKVVFRGDTSHIVITRK